MKILNKDKREDLPSIVKVQVETREEMKRA
jgi:hypothetical protein